ncbi:MAG: helix-turn-helix domain-containing protein [Acidimicrobiales bacterium]
MSEVPMGGLPDLLTIEEAARVLRVGRTKAYAMAQEWRATGGQSGLPVVDFGHVLRVPLCQLERIVGGPLTAWGTPLPVTGVAPTGEAAATADASPARGPAPTPGLEPVAPTIPALEHASAPSRAERRPTRRHTVAPDQPSLPFAS